MTPTSTVTTEARPDGSHIVTATVDGWDVRTLVRAGPVRPRGRNTVRHAAAVAGAEQRARNFASTVERHLADPDYRHFAALYLRSAARRDPSRQRQHPPDVRAAMRALAAGRSTRAHRARLARLVASPAASPDTLLAEAVIVCAAAPPAHPAPPTVLRSAP